MSDLQNKDNAHLVINERQIKSAFRKILAESRPKPPSESGDYGIAWVTTFSFYNPAWYRNRSMTDLIVDVFSRARWWQELHMLSCQYDPGAPFTSLAEVKALLRIDAPLYEPLIRTVARGESDVARWHSETDAALMIEIAPESRMDLAFKLRRGSLERHSEAALTDTIEAILTLATAWRSLGRLVQCVGFPDPPNRIAYPHLRPPRTAGRRLDAIVDIVDPNLPSTLVSQRVSDDARAIGTTPTSAGIQRTEREGLVALRWVENPTDRAAMEHACAQHEHWITPLLHTEIAEGWSEASDLEVVIGNYSAKAEPLSFVDTTDRVGYLEMTVGNGGEVDEEAWQTAVVIARKGRLRNGSKLNGVTVIAQDRTAALQTGPEMLGYAFFTEVEHHSGIRFLLEIGK